MATLTEPQPATLSDPRASVEQLGCCEPLRDDVLPGGVISRFGHPLNGEFTCQVVTDAAAAKEFVSEWDDLAADATVPNPFYESWQVLAAWNGDFQPAPDCLLLVYGSSKRPDQAPVLCGLLPLATVHPRSLPKRISPARVKAWEHDYCCSTVPLVRKGFERETATAFFNFLREEKSYPGLIEFPNWLAEGSLSQTIVELARDGLVHPAPRDTITRAMFRIPDDLDRYLAETLSSGRRQELRRQRRKLLGDGPVELRTCGPEPIESPHESECWANWFLDLEAAGWKGREGTAMACRSADALYFRSLIETGASQGRVQFLGLFRDGEPLALKCNFRSGPGLFTFRIAYREDLRKLSPGVQLELENMRIGCELPGVEWMDSCAVTDHPMIDRLWGERRTMQRLVVSTGSVRSRAFLAASPLIKFLRHPFRIGG